MVRPGGGRLPHRCEGGQPELPVDRLVCQPDTFSIVRGHGCAHVRLADQLRLRPASLYQYLGIEHLPHDGLRRSGRAANGRPLLSDAGKQCRSPGHGRRIPAQSRRGRKDSELRQSFQRLLQQKHAGPRNTLQNVQRTLYVHLRQRSDTP